MLDFTNRPWLRLIYKDRADRMVIKKASQVGLTDFAINTTFAHAMRGEAVLYVLPRDKDVYNFTPRRIDKLINSSDFLRANCAVERKASDTKSQKTLFGTDCHFVGSQAAENFYEKPCDVLIIDEFDKCAQDNLPYAYDRLASSDKERWYKFGNPTILGTGIDKEFDLSDRKHWMLKCPACNEHQVIGWHTHCVDEAEGGFVLKHPDAPICSKCGKPIDRLMAGEWVAEFPDRDVSGYAVSQLFARVSSENVIAGLLSEFNAARSNPSALQRFYNNVLGEPYRAVGAALSHELLGACAGELTLAGHNALSGPVIGGADVGAVIHLHISKIVNGKRHKVFIGHCQTFEELARLSKQYGVQRGVIDALPEKHKVAEFLAANHRWFCCYYNLEAGNKSAIEIDHRTRTVRTNKTASCDETYATWVAGQVVLPVNWQGLDGGDFLDQMLAPTRIYVEHATDSSKDRWEWREGSKADHHFHADNYERIAADLYGRGNNLVTVVG